MPSIAPNFEYDILISYRHNDNRSGWVTEFVNALQEELAATIKEPLTIYFDRNPHDGLLETHNVDKSLEGKLKCLIFIPIISQTYCDTKSFAWQLEFVAFNKLAKEDQFGRDIKLTNGNVASRILPIKIHDLDAEDKSLLENEMGGVLRAIEFIFKSSGVNRPLTSSDKREENSSKTFYRDQINKVANAIKEIITALKNPVRQAARTTINEQRTTIPKRNRKALLALFILLLLIAISYFFYQQRSTNPDSYRDEQPTLDKSIAVLPFANISNSKDQDYFCEGLSDALRILLGKVPDLRVAGQISSTYFKERTDDINEIGSRLGVAHLLTGSVQKSGDQLRVSVKLIKVESGTQLWSESYTKRTEQIFELQDEIAQTISDKLKFIFEKPGDHSLSFGTTNIEAYEQYLMGLKIYYLAHVDFNDAQLQEATTFFKKAIELDPNFGYPYHFISDYYVHRIERSDLNSQEREDTYQQIHLYFDKAIQYSNDATRSKLLNVEKNLMLDHWNKVAQSLDSFIQDPNSPKVASETGLGVTAIAFVLLHKEKELLNLCNEALKLDPLNPLLWQFGATVLVRKDPKEAMEYLAKGEAILKTRLSIHDYVESQVAGSYKQDELKPDIIQSMDKMPYGHLVLMGLVYDGHQNIISANAPNFTERIKELEHAN